MTNMKIIFSAIALIVVVGGGYAGYTVWEEETRAQELAAEKARQEKIAQEEARAKAAAIAARTKCTEINKFLVVTQDRDGGIGQDILLKPTSENSGLECAYSVAEADFELKNSDPQYFKGLGGNALITDVGTGPSGRSLRIYDLTDKKLITEKQYFNELNITDDKLVYFGLAKQKADAKNCADYKKITSEGLTPNLVVEKTVDLKTFLVKEGKTTKCVASQ